MAGDHYNKDSPLVIYSSVAQTIKGTIMIKHLPKFKVTFFSHEKASNKLK